MKKKRDQIGRKTFEAVAARTNELSVSQAWASRK
jgi:hypothetical protein